MPHTTQRFEFNRSLNRILARHSVNLNELSLCISGSLIRLSGRLERHPSGTFKPREIHALLQDLEALPYRLVLQFLLDNWVVEKHGGAWRISARAQDTSEDPVGGSFASALTRVRREASRSSGTDC
ncbi:MAG: hypothetical protein ACOCWR_03065 [Oceanidesulfovibrio sp.]